MHWMTVTKISPIKTTTKNAYNVMVYGLEKILMMPSTQIDSILSEWKKEIRKI